jgi:hypothetical protein
MVIFRPPAEPPSASAADILDACIGGSDEVCSGEDCAELFVVVEIGVAGADGVAA